MALTLNNFVGFETGGLEELSAVGGAPSNQTSIVRTGSYALSILGVAWAKIKPFESVSDAGDKQIIGFAYYSTDTTPAVINNILYAQEDNSFVAANRCFRLQILLNGDLRIEWNDATTNTIAAPLTDSTWHYIEIVWEHADPGTFDISIDGGAPTSYVGKDLRGVGVNFDRYALGGAANANYYDDIYCMSGAAGVGDFLGTAVEVLGAFQNTVEDATDQGTPLDQGTWAITGDTPGVDDGVPAAYTGAAETGYTVCDEGVREGSGALITGTAKGAKWIHRLNRGNGSGTTHGSRCGKNVSVSDSGDLGLTNVLVNYFRILTNVLFMPNVNTDNFSQGFWKSVGGRELYCADIWACLLHVAPDPSTLDLTDFAFPDQNYYLGPLSV